MTLTITRLSIHGADGQMLVRDVTLQAATGTALMVIGETGSGKTLIGLALLGLLPEGLHASGTMRAASGVETDLADTVAVRGQWCQGTALLPQEPLAALDPTMRMGRQMEPSGLAAVGLAAEVRLTYPFELSGGMAQRVVVAAALEGAAPVIVVDEPTKGLDPARVRQVIALLRRLLDHGRTLLVITHDPMLVAQLGGSTAVLHDGQIVEWRPTAALFAAPLHAYTQAWLEADPAAWPALPSFAGGGVVADGVGLAFGYTDGPPLFEGVDVTVRRGGVLGLTGPSGCGKTTLGGVLAGLLPPQAGSVSWQGVDPYRDRRGLRRMRRRYQKLHQEPASVFLPHRSVGQQLQDLVEVVPDLDVTAALPPLLRQLGLRPALLARRPGELSGGEAQRFALIRLLLLDPVLVVADEPTSRLDPILQRDTIQMLHGMLQARGIGLVLISHSETLLAAVADEVLTLG